MPSVRGPWRELQARLQPHLGHQEGRIPTAIPGLWLFRAEAPQALKRVEARMVTLAVILQGRKRVTFGDVEMTYNPGDYLFVLGERRYGASIELASQRQPYLSISLELEPESIVETILSLSDAGVELTEPGGHEDAVVGHLDGSILSTLERLAVALDDPAGPLLAPLAKRELLIHLLRSPSGSTLRHAAARDDGRIRRAVNYIQNHVAERLSVERVARHVRMSPSHFAHRFREIIRMSPMQYVKHLRLQQARLLMLGEGFGAAEAGSRVGYASPSHFTRDFKSYYGAPPAAYVQQFRRAS